MANEINISTSISATKNGVTLSNNSSKTLDMAGDQMISNVQIVGITYEAALLGDVVTIGYVFIKNMDTTNFIEVDSATAMNAFPQKLKAGEFCILKPETATIYLKADTAPCNVQVVAFEL